jgi:ketosteroid isomerase-like protein
MSTTTRTVVDELLRRLAAGSPDRVAELYADQVDWRLNWPLDTHDADVPWIRTRSSRVDVADHYRTIAAEHVPEHAGFDLERVVVDGPEAVVIGTIRNTVRRTGGSYRAHFALHLTVKDALIVRHHVYEDSLAVARAWSGK